MTDTTPLLDLQNKLSKEFKADNGQGSPVLERRRQAIDSFNTLGFPTTKNEEWKYTNLEKFILGSNDTSVATGSGKLHLPKIAVAHLLVFVDGIYDATLSHLMPGDPGIVVLPFSIAQNSHSELVAQYFGKSLAPDTNGMVALNTAFATEGAFIHVPKGQHPRFPVQVIHVSGHNGGKYLQHLRHLVIVDEHASLDIIENYITNGDNEYFLNLVSEIYVGQNAKVNQYRFQEENNETARQVGFVQVTQESNSLVNNFTVTTGGKLVRNDLQYRMAGQNCESHMFGLYIGSGNQHIDNHTLMDHALPHCFSNEFYKGIMAGKSTGIFNGKVIVRQDAQKTNAYQSNKNILLSDEAHVNTKPQLEIFANDVKCSHGATMGQLDDEALFYLRSRGIGLVEAKAILVQAFAADVLENIKNEPLKIYAKQLVENKLHAL